MTRKMGNRIMSLLKLGMRSSYRFMVPIITGAIRKFQRSDPKLKLLLSCLVILLSFPAAFFAMDEVDRVVVEYRQEDVKSSGLNYPMNLRNFRDVVHRFRRERLNISSVPGININDRYSNITFLKSGIEGDDLDVSIELLIVVKSATRNYRKREAIRKSWGETEYLNQVSLSTKLVFICGIPRDFVVGDTLFPEEEGFNDIILAEFDDNYFNNTYKSVLALRWGATVFPSDYQYLLLCDDDMYINLENLSLTLSTLKDRKILKNPNPKSSMPFLTFGTQLNHSTPGAGAEILGTSLYMGYVYGAAMPIRSKRKYFRGSIDWKWAVSLEDYPFNWYPPYIPGSAMLFSKVTVSDLYYASFFVKHLWIDDIFVGILAYKMGVMPLHNPNFISDYDGLKNVRASKFKNAISLHGFHCPDQMMDLVHTGNLTAAQSYPKLCEKLVPVK